MKKTYTPKSRFVKPSPPQSVVDDDRIICGCDACIASLEEEAAVLAVQDIMDREDLELQDKLAATARIWLSLCGEGGNA